MKIPTDRRKIDDNELRLLSYINRQENTVMNQSLLEQELNEENLVKKLEGAVSNQDFKTVIQMKKKTNQKNVKILTFKKI